MVSGKPYSTGIFETIVNCHFGDTETLVAGLSNFAPFSSDVFSSISADEDLGWRTEFEGAGTNVASGFNRTVVASEMDYVAFGKPRNGDKCFIFVSRSGTIERGVIEDEELVWKDVGTVDLRDGIIAISSCNFAGGKFFIGTYNRSDDEVNFYVSATGNSFSRGPNVFPGVIAAANGTGTEGNQSAHPEGGSIAYDKDRGVYVSVGYYERTYIEDVFIVDHTVPVALVDLNFMSAISSDGISWSPTFDTSEASYGGAGHPGGPTLNAGYSVAFGNGVWVAAGSKKYAFRLNSGGILDYTSVGWASAAVVSRNGVSWSVHELPGQPDPNPRDGFPSEATAVRFVKADRLPGVDDFIEDGPTDIEGYFVIGSNQYPVNKLWYSVHGTSWREVNVLPFHQHPFVLTTARKLRGEIIYK